MNKDLKFSHAIIWIIASTLIVSGFSYFAYFQYKKMQNNRNNNSNYNIKVISQSVKEDSLDVNYLAQIMNLSKDAPTNIFCFDEEIAKQKLLLNPIIKSAEVKKIKPNCIFVDYELKKPIALLYDFDNVAIDEEGNTFPYKPFFKEENLCKIYLGLDAFDGFKKINSKEAILAIDILKKLQLNDFSKLVKIIVLDTSRSKLQSYSQREVLLEIQEELFLKKNGKDVRLVFPKVLRLMENNYLQQIGNYISLREKILKDYVKQFKNAEFQSDEIMFKPKTVDLRISKLAFIDQ